MSVESTATRVYSYRDFVVDSLMKIARMMPKSRSAVSARTMEAVRARRTVARMMLCFRFVIKGEGAKASMTLESARVAEGKGVSQVGMGRRKPGDSTSFRDSLDVKSTVVFNETA